MKKLLLITLAVIFFVACQEKQPQRYFADSAETETLKSGIKAYETGDWEAWKSHFSDTAKIYVNSIKPMSVDDRGNDLKESTSAMSSYGFNHDKEYVEMVLDKEDETWVYYWAAHKGTFAASGKEVIIPVHLAVQFVDGKIVEEHVYYDGTEMNAEFAALMAAEADEAEESTSEEQ
jgi:ketosteroid isomerase-like protein